ncbi:epoxyqueuosine reductase [Clostridium formicaceticum]|uniref:4Fe-4S ferredoxin n=1 Tax=Clostridium formicaceticum TaxID=1497 RepID=A0AAC9RJD8_9CLOT|nr:epoxyqueuosine reductase [Clostridium formicaceticum]AOY76218.1 4Fe-4S ferredoxin [Clostridium formicaceticum]ARE86597.1 Epoxyqueuosine reductase [Clostridium formicaceticum]
MDKQQQLTTMIFNLGAAKVGYGQLEDVLPEEFKHLISGISIAIRLSDQVISDIDPQNGPTHTYFHHYRTVNAFIDQMTFKITNQLQQWGYLAMAIPASQSINLEGWNYRGLFQHRTAATKAGIGWIGKNNCLVTEEFGPRVRLGTVLTNMVFDYNEAITMSQCGECNLCVKLCPANALKGKTWKPEVLREEMMCPDTCSNHMKNKYKHIGRGAVCGICIKACKKGKQILKT